MQQALAVELEQVLEQVLGLEWALGLVLVQVQELKRVLLPELELAQ